MPKKNSFTFKDLEIMIGILFGYCLASLGNALIFNKPWKLFVLNHRQAFYLAVLMFIIWFALLVKNRRK